MRVVEARSFAGNWGTQKHPMWMPDAVEVQVWRKRDGGAVRPTLVEEVAPHAARPFAGISEAISGRFAPDRPPHPDRGDPRKALRVLVYREATF